jgi:hypothetical protein
LARNVNARRVTAQRSRTHLEQLLDRLDTEFFDGRIAPCAVRRSRSPGSNAALTLYQRRDLVELVETLVVPDPECLALHLEIPAIE